VVRLESRPPNLEGEGEVKMRDLVRNCLRMRPERIIVGEVRGPEAFDLLQAMNTGHDGSMGTLHANSPREALSRLESMITMGGFQLPPRTIREMVVASIDVIVQVARLRDGSRRITHITEVVGMEGDVVITQDLFVYDFIGEDFFGGLPCRGDAESREESSGLSREAGFGGIEKVGVSFGSGSGKQEGLDMDGAETRGPFEALQAARDVFGGGKLSATVARQECGNGHIQKW